MIGALAVRLGWAGSPRRRLLFVAGAVALAGAWGALLVGTVHREIQAPSASPRDATDPAGLRLEWTADVGRPLHGPVVAGSTLYAGSDGGELLAFPVSCRAAVTGCAPLWRGELRTIGATAPAAADGTVFIGSSETLYAFAPSCRSVVCRPLWTGETLGPITAPVVVSGVVYVGSEDGRLYAFPARCRPPRGPCDPLWIGAVPRGAYAAPAVSGGVVYVGSDDGKLYAFPARCRPVGGWCRPLFVGHTSLAGALVSTPAVARDRVFVTTERHRLFAFPAHCRTDRGRCGPLWTARAGSSLSAPAAAGDYVYTGSLDGSVLAFPADCGTGGASCRPAWTAPVEGPANFSTPVVRSGVVYVGTFDGAISAFPAACERAGGCVPLWSADEPGTLATPVLTGASLYVGSDLGTLYAWTRPATEAAAGRRDGLYTLLFYATLLGVGGVLAVGRRRLAAPYGRASRSASRRSA